MNERRQPLRTSIWNVSEWAYGGVDHSLAGNGGPECAGFLSMQRRVAETIFATVLGIIIILWGVSTAELPRVNKSKVVRQDRGGKRALLVFMCIIYGIEFGFKFSSKTMIYILNPCHVITLMEIFMLGAPPTNRWLTCLFRVHIHCMNCPILALLFPVLNTRLLAFEQQNYWIQHVLMLVIPFYLLRTGVGGVFTMEPLNDYSWVKITVGIQMLYHFLVLQPLAVATQVNLNSMLCPAVSDPFNSQHYRLIAIVHQSLMIPIVGKLYTALSIFVLKALGSIVWTGEKYVAMATLRMQQVCSMCTLQLPGARNNVGAVVGAQSTTSSSNDALIDGATSASSYQSDIEGASVNVRARVKSGIDGASDDLVANEVCERATGDAAEGDKKDS